MSFELSYRPIAKKAYSATIAASIFAFLIILRIQIPNLLETDWYIATLKIIFAGSIPITILLRSYFVFRPRIFAQYELVEGLLIQTFKKERTEYEFSRIDFFRFSRIPPRFGGGFIIRLKSGRRLVFLSVLQNNEVILKSIHAARPDLISLRELRKYEHKMRVLDYSWARAVNKLKQWPALLIKYLGIPLLLTWIVRFNYAPEGVSFVSMLGIFTLILWLAALILNFLEDGWVASLLARTTEKSNHTCLTSKQELSIQVTINTIYLLLALALFLIALRYLPT